LFPPCSPRGTKRGDSGAKGVVNSNFTLETARSTLFDAIFIPDGDEKFLKELSSGRGLHWIREACVSSFSLSSSHSRSSLD